MSSTASSRQQRSGFLKTLAGRGDVLATNYNDMSFETIIAAFEHERGLPTAVQHMAQRLDYDVVQETSSVYRFTANGNGGDL